MSTCNTFIHSVNALPAWLTTQTSRVGQFRPIDLPVVRPHQLTIDDAMSRSLNGHATLDRKAPCDPGVDSRARNAHQPGDGGLAPGGLKSGVKFDAHADIVQIQSANSQPDQTALVIKSSYMDIWKNIEDELHRRRLNAAWLGRKLDASRQVVSGWKTRGVPTARYEEIAELLGWTLDRLVSPQGADAAPAAPAQQAAQPGDYSPMALDIARRLDGIADDQQRSRAYALFLQIVTLSNAPAPTPAGRVQAGLETLTTPTRRYTT